jgi:SnoaL-like polyketide cyclase
MGNADLEIHYRAYLDVLNERRLDDLVHFVQDELSYNGKTMTRRQYQELITADITAIPDLFYDAHIIVASGDQVACRIVFDCTAAQTSGLLTQRRTTHPCGARLLSPPQRPHCSGSVPDRPSGHRDTAVYLPGLT